MLLGALVASLLGNILIIGAGNNFYCRPML